MSLPSVRLRTCLGISSFYSNCSIPACLRLGIIIVFIITGAGALSAEQATAAPLVQNGPANLNESVLGSRFRAFRTTGDLEMFVGVPSLGNPPPQRAQANVVWAPTNTVALVYDDTGQTLRSTVQNVNGTFSATFDLALNPPSNFGKTTPLDMLNAMNITLLDRDDNANAVFDNIMINGNMLGNTLAGTGASTISITNLPLQLGFTLSGRLLLSGNFSNSSERSRLDVSVGFDPSAAIVPEPALAALAALGLAVTAAARTRRKQRAGEARQG